MRKISKLQLFLFALLSLSLSFPIFAPHAQAVECKSATQKNCTVTIRDNRGIKIGTEERSSNGVTTVRDSQGIKQGTITTTSSKPSCEIIRDSRGLKIGTRGKC
jgi:hypothetical protein